MSLKQNINHISIWHSHQWFPRVRCWCWSSENPVTSAYSQAVITSCVNQPKKTRDQEGQKFTFKLPYMWRLATLLLHNNAQEINKDVTWRLTFPKCTRSPSNSEHSFFTSGEEANNGANSLDPPSCMRRSRHWLATGIIGSRTGLGTSGIVSSFLESGLLSITSEMQSKHLIENKNLSTFYAIIH